MMRCCLSLIGVVGLSVPVMAAGGEPGRTYKLKYHVAPAPTTLAEFSALGKRGLQTHQRPEGVTHREYKSEDPVFVQVPMPGSDRVRWAALDTVAPPEEADAGSPPGLTVYLYSSVRPLGTPAQGYIPDRLYFDRDGDNDLTDEKPLKGRPIVSGPDAGVPRYMVFPTVRVGAVIEGRELAYHIRIAAARSYARLFLNRLGGALEVPAYAVSACYYEGRVELGGKPVRVALLDTDVDGRFDARSHLPEGQRAPTRGDALIISERAGQPIKPQKSGAAARRMLGRYLALGDEWYEVQVAPGGASVTVGAEKPDVGVVQARQPSAEVRLANADGVHDLRMDAEGARVPIGAYQVLSCTLHETDGQDREWALTCYPANPGPTAIEVSAGKTTQLPFGAPLLWSLTVDTERQVPRPGIVRRGETDTLVPAVYFSMRLAAQGGMRVSGMTVNGEQPPKPRLTIKDAAGNAVHEVAFEYG